MKGSDMFFNRHARTLTCATQEDAQFVKVGERTRLDNRVLDLRVRLWSNYSTVRF